MWYAIKKRICIINIVEIYQPLSQRFCVFFVVKMNRLKLKVIEPENKTVNGCGLAGLFIQLFSHFRLNLLN